MVKDIDIVYQRLKKVSGNEIYKTEQLNIFDMTRPIFKIDKPIRLIELFAGIGSQAMALRDLGTDFEHYRAVEFDRFAVSSYNAIHGTDFKPTDIRDVNAADLGVSDTDKYCYIMTYSFPCKDLSVAGRQKGMKKGEGTRSGLLWEVERLLNECPELPQVLLMENVPQVHSVSNMSDFQKWIDFLSSKGYSSYWQDLNAKDYGVAQSRNRCFMISLLGEWNYKFSQPILLKRKMKDYLEDEVDEKYYINTEKARELIQTLIKNGTLQDEDKNIEIKQVGNLTEMVSRDNPNRRRVYNTNGLSPTLTSAMGEGGNLQPFVVVIDNGKYRIRKVTPLECWRLMTFSDEDFHKAEEVSSNSQLYKQAGNSIVKKVLMAIFGQMISGRKDTE